jgi:hypothetical protein
LTVDRAKRVRGTRRMLAVGWILLGATPVFGAGTLPSGYVAFDYISFVPPGGWREEMNAHHASYVGPSVGCIVSVGPARPSAGSVLADAAASRRTIPGNMVAATPRVERWQNGWDVAVTAYRYPHASATQKIIVNALRDGITQPLVLDLDSDNCRKSMKRSVDSLRMLATRQRVNQYGTAVPLVAAAPPPAQSAGASKLMGNICKAGNISCYSPGKVGERCLCSQLQGGLIWGERFAEYLH